MTKREKIKNTSQVLRSAYEIDGHKTSREERGIGRSGEKRLEGSKYIYEIHVNELLRLSF